MTKRLTMRGDGLSASRGPAAEGARYFRVASTSAAARYPVSTAPLR